MNRQHRLATTAAVALGAFALTLTAVAAPRHDIVVKNCLSNQRHFLAFDENDSSLIVAASDKLIQPKSQDGLHCRANSYCKVFPFDTTESHFRVYSAITFYSATATNNFIDADCSRGPVKSGGSDGSKPIQLE